jgi:type II secretory pathway component PulF
MAYFLYTAVDRISGTKQRGVITAEHLKEAFEILSNINLVPENIYEIPGIIANLLRTKPHMKIAEIIEFFKGIGHALNAGVPLLEILVAYQNELPSKKARAAIQEMALKISQGQPFSQVLRELKFFPILALAFAEIGEATGNLGENLIKAAERIEFLESLKSQAKKAMVYPCFVISVMILAIIMWLFIVIPKMSQFLTALNLKLPVYTQWLLYISQHRIVILYFLGAIVGVIVVTMIINRLIKKLFSKEHIVLYLQHKLLLGIPLVGKIVYNYNHFLIASFTGALIGAGITISQVFNILFQTVNNAVFFKALQKIDSLVREGESLSEAFRQSGVFSSLFTRYVMVGERTGTLDNQLEFLADYYREKVDSVLSVLPKLLEPILILFVGGIMFGMIMAVFMPIYSSISKVLKAVGQ